jgi:predicted enzyme related to lactoylglutathione lyase
MAMLVYAGTVEAGERAVAPFRALATPIVDMVRPMRYPEIYPPEQPGFHPVAAARSLFVDTVDRRAAETIVDQIQAATAQMAVTQIRVLGGAMARVPAEATAFAHRTQRIMVNVAALYQDADEAAVHEAWVSGLAAALRRENAGVYVNFLGDEGEARVHEAYPGPTWDRLATIKARHDPTNLFRLNHNIPPKRGRGREGRSRIYAQDRQSGTRQDGRLHDQGIRTVIYPVQDIVRAKPLYRRLLGVEPYMDEAYYVGFAVGDQDIGLDPNGHSAGMTGPIGYYHVDDIEQSLRGRLDAGAQLQQPLQDVGGGKRIASVRDADGNVIGLIQM